MTTTPANAPPARIQLTPLRTFHIDHGQGRTVAVLFRVAVDHRRRPGDNSHQQRRNKQAKPGIGARK